MGATHEQAHGLRTYDLTAPAWERGVRQSTPNGRFSAEAAREIADRSWDGGDVETAAYWYGYAAGAIRRPRASVKPTESHHLSTNQRAVLVFVQGTPGVGDGEIARQTGMTEGSVSFVLSRLHRRGYVTASCGRWYTTALADHKLAATAKVGS